MSELNRCIIFDLDGTLADTLADIALSVNLTRRDFHLPELSYEQVKSYVGDGARKLLERAFQDHPIDVELGLKLMVDHYYDFPVVKTSLYPGVATGLAVLHAHGYKLAVITNKPGKVARRILQILEVDQYLSGIIGGGDGFALKPAPDAPLYLLKKFNAIPEKSWILGDNHTDLDAATNSRMQGAFAQWGFGQQKQAVCTASFADFQSFARQMINFSDTQSDTMPPSV